MTGNVLKTDALNTVSKTAAFTVSRTQDHGKTFVLNLATGFTVTLPAANGSGNVYRFIIGTTTSSTNTYVINASTNGADFFGVCLADDGDGEPANGFFTAANNNTITLGGSSNATGGVKGEYIEIIDFATDSYHVRIFGQQGGTEATPFSTV